jgi:hypothetical protein
MPSKGKKESEGSQSVLVRDTNLISFGYSAVFRGI